MYDNINEYDKYNVASMNILLYINIYFTIHFFLGSSLKKVVP